MSNERLILNIVIKLEEKFGVLAWAHKDFMSDGSFRWWSICIDNYEVYKNDKVFKKLTYAWHKVSKQKLVFFCQSAQEKNFEKLLNENNLIMNV